jgi:tRNA(Met) cytidine acetyltransferase
LLNFNFIVFIALKIVDKMEVNKFSAWLERVQKQAKEKNQRQLILMVTDVENFKQLAYCSLNKNTDNVVIYSRDADIESSIDIKYVKKELGSENQCIYFAENNINFDAFSALSGTLIAGGVMLIFVEQSIYLNFNSTEDNSITPSTHYFLKQIAKDKTVLVVEKNKPLPSLNTHLPKALTVSESNEHSLNVFSYSCKTKEQEIAVKHILKVSTGHRNRPLVLTADRGRGKSSALAIACAELMLIESISGIENQKIYISAPNIRALSVFFMQMQSALPQAKHTKTGVYLNGHQLEFIALDHLLSAKPKASLILIDEAAGFPVYLLSQLLAFYHRLVFSSTVHGYEGAGRGFAIKFKEQLQKYMPQWRGFHINEPIRWREKDPLEAFVFGSCLLNADLPKLNSLATNSTSDSPLDFEKISTIYLADNPVLLAQVFAVLVTAHYQTSPNDIKLLLDNSAVHLIITKQNDVIVAVALLLEEGGITETAQELEVVDKIVTSQRRLKDQFIPQSLLAHCGFKGSFSYKYLRILRLAVHPQLHARGIGSKLLGYIESYSRSLGFDFLGASFGANAQLLKFWRGNNYRIARMGFSQDKASGEHSALVLKSLNARSDEFQQDIISQFYASFDYLLNDEFKQLSADLVWQILHDYPQHLLPALKPFEQQAVSDFASKKRQYSLCVSALHKWCLAEFTYPVEAAHLLLISRVLQKKSLEDVCLQYQFSGKKALNNALLTFVQERVLLSV